MDGKGVSGALPDQMNVHVIFERTPVKGSLFAVFASDVLCAATTLPNTFAVITAAALAKNLQPGTGVQSQQVLKM